MAGILNNKERVMDFTITQEGKRQAGTGEMRINYATFTDLHTFYDTSGSAEIPTLASDASDRIFFETFNRYQDVIVPELEAGLSMRPFRTQDFQSFGDGTVASGSFSTGLVTLPNLQTGSQIDTIEQRVLEGLTRNFIDQRVVATADEFSLYQDISISPLTASFITPQVAVGYMRGSAQKNIRNVPSIFFDKRFEAFPNFKFLPPINKSNPGAINSDVPLANYPELNERYKNDDEELVGTEKRVLTYEQTSRNNNLAVQVFEKSETGIQKLSMVDLGLFEKIMEGTSTTKKIRRVKIGKLLLDPDGSETFANIFTLEFDYGS